ncbi:MAG TPA: DEAD/DEAH box helicase [Polyangia bacterium]|jgi:hypothetical protein
MRSDDLAKQFSDEVRRRGAACHRAGVISITAHGATAIRAVAVGARDESVRIEVEARTLVLGCSCADFKRSDRCKHLWAAALAADARGWLAPLPAYTKVRLAAEKARTEAPTAADGEGEDGGEDDQDDGAPLRGGSPSQPVPHSARLLQPRADTPTALLRRVVRPSAPAMTPPAPPPAGPPRAWQTLLLGEGAGGGARWPQPALAVPLPPLLFVIDVEKTRLDGELTLTLRMRSPRKGGDWQKDKQARISIRAMEWVKDEHDRQALPLIQAALAIVGAAGPSWGNDYYASGFGSVGRCFPAEVRVPPTLAGQLMPLLSQSGRLFVRDGRGAELVPARYDGEPPWDFHLVLRRRADQPMSEIAGRLQRGEERADLTAPLAVTSSGWVIFADRIGQLRHFGAFTLLASLRKEPVVAIAAADERPFLQSLYALPALPRLEVPEDLALIEVAVAARPFLKLGAPDSRASAVATRRVAGHLMFFYGDMVVAAADPRDVLPQFAEGRLLRRDRDSERAAAVKLAETGFDRLPPTPYHAEDMDRFDIAPSKLPAAVRILVEAGWRVEAEGKLYRQAGHFDLSVSSGVDWFDLDARADFDGVAVALPDLLRALRRGESTIVLGDGSLGVLPEDWLRRYGLLADMGAIVDGRMRFGRAQVGLLDALLAAVPEATTDRLFDQARDELRRFEGVSPEKAPAEFRGALRPYQELGLGWMSFLRRFGFGGCLADDMGLGKTVQVLAMLAARPRATGRPSLVVAPKSLVWNWQQEAARFAPKLRVLAHVGPDRAGDAAAFSRAVRACDLVVTTYGLLRKDVPFMRELELDYVILDEAQAVKNRDSESAKAVRLLRGRHRLALSGTPIENHIGELWSLIEFLNPGMLGTARAFADLVGTKRPDPEALALLSRTLRPFFLRRTKAEVAPELPAKHEETILCEMEPEQRRLYDELRAHYRASLLGKIEREGMGRAKIQVLEALLRLRQAACHPGLIDGKRARDRSGKLEVLLARLDEVRQEGHKALVFSQFTSFLALVRARLAAAKIPYEYLDGQTVDREERVRRFQSDASCPLFLISLKAGGVGLNLTAADYVFILDPWWNPAVEAQAVDRAHRIGQDKQVFVYRLLCRDSVEEKVAALQDEKRDLAAAILGADGSLMQKLDRETLEALLG